MSSSSVISSMSDASLFCAASVVVSLPASRTSFASAAVDSAAPVVSSDKHALQHKWDAYCHLPQSTDWSLAGYRAVFLGMATAEDVISLCEAVPEAMLRFAMWFVMRSGVAPQWEDPRNRNGGSFSFKLLHRQVPEIWTNVFLALTGSSLCRNAQHHANVMGITISPKKNFCILKIWMTDCTLQSVDIFADIPGLTKQKCLFRQHTPES